MAVLDNVEDLAIGTVLGVAGSVKSTILRFISVAVSPFASPSLPWHRAQARVHHSLARATDSGEDLTGFGCLAASTGIAA